MTGLCVCFQLMAGSSYSAMNSGDELVSPNYCLEGQSHVDHKLFCWSLKFPAFTHKLTVFQIPYTNSHRRQYYWRKLIQRSTFFHLCLLATAGGPLQFADVLRLLWQQHIYRHWLRLAVGIPYHSTHRFRRLLHRSAACVSGLMSHSVISGTLERSWFTHFIYNNGGRGVSAY